MKSFDGWKDVLGKVAKRMGFPMEEKTLYILALPGLLCGAEIQNQKFLCHEAVPLEEGQIAEEIASAFLALEEKGLKEKQLVLLVNQPSCRFLEKKFPDMTEEELEESLYWEEDRIFYTGEPMALGHRVLSHTPEGYETLLAAWPRKELEPWLEGAKQAGKVLRAAVPIMDISLGTETFFALYGKKDSGTLLFRKKERIWKKRVTLSEENGAFFMQSMMRQQEELRVPCFVIPMADCKEDTWEAWQQWMDEAMRTVNAGQSDMIDIEEGWETETGESMPIAETGTLHLYWGNSQEVSEPHSLWERILPLFIYAESSGIQFPLSHERALPFFRKENRTLRLMQGLMVGAALFCLFSIGRYVQYAMQETRLQQELESLQTVKEKWLAQKQEEKKEQDRLALLKQLEKEDLHWEQKLVMLADGLPQGVVLSHIKTEGSKVQLVGTATSSMPLQSFEKQLKWTWGGDVRLVKRRNHTHTKLVEFTLEWKNGEE